jgi:hypothetical protein
MERGSTGVVRAKRRISIPLQNDRPGFNERLGDTRAVELQNRTEFSSKEFGIPKLEACQIVAVSGLRQDNQQRVSE